MFLNPIHRGPRVIVSWTAKTRDDGSFEFAHAPPVACSVNAELHWGIPSPLNSSEYLPLRIDPGSTVNVTLGGPGIEVTGQLVAEGQPPEFDYHFGINYLVARRTGIEPPAWLSDKGFDWKKGWSDAWRNSSEGGAYLQTLHHWFVKPEPNGRFRISGLAPGDYNFSVNLYGATEGCLVHPRAVGVVHISLRDRESHVDLGMVPIRSVTAPKIGEMAGDFEFDMPAGRKSSISALRGNYVLVDFWATWCKPCVEKLDQVERLAEQFTGNKPLVVVGANLDANPERARQFLKSRPLGWKQAFLGDWSDTDVPRRYSIASVPAFVLIDPNGRIAAQETSLEAITLKLRDVAQKPGTAPKK